MNWIEISIGRLRNSNINILKISYTVRNCIAHCTARSPIKSRVRREEIRSRNNTYSHLRIYFCHRNLILTINVLKYLDTYHSLINLRNIEVDRKRQASQWLADCSWMTRSWYNVKGEVHAVRHTPSTRVWVANRVFSAANRTFDVYEYGFGVREDRLWRNAALIRVGASLRITDDSRTWFVKPSGRSFLA